MLGILAVSLVQTLSLARKKSEYLTLIVESLIYVVGMRSEYEGDPF